MLIPKTKSILQKTGNKISVPEYRIPDVISDIVLHNFRPWNKMSQESVKALDKLVKVKSTKFRFSQQ